MTTLALFAGQLVASPVGVEQARRVGMKYAQQNAAKQVTTLDLVYTEQTASGVDALYVFNFEGGFVIVSADNVAKPILAISDEGNFDPNHMPDGLVYYLGYYAREIDYAIANNPEPDALTMEQWANVERYGVMNLGGNSRGHHDIQPILTTSWNQDSPYNMYCPSGSGPGGHAYAGCVATAMSMVMKHWNWPIQGNGQHSYTPSGYPTQTVDFGATTYDWANMPNSCNNSNYQAVATLMYHCGVAVDMQYSGSGSGAYSADVPGAIADYFRYTPNSRHLYRELYTLDEWIEELVACLEEGFPMYYSASDPNQGGHAFGCDGYRASDNFFHFNWGWSGYGNSYYSLTTMNAPGYHFTENHSAILDMIPDYVYDGLIAAVDFTIEAENAHSKTGVIRWTNPEVNMGGNAITNIDQVVLLRNDVEIFSQSNIAPGEEMSFVDQVSDYDCYSYRLYYVTDGVKGRFSDKTYQYGPTCTWKIIGQTTNFQGWNGGKIQVLNAFNTVIDEITMTSSTPISQQVRMPEGNVTFKWVAPSTAVSSLTINIKNSANQSVYSYSGNSNQLPATMYTGDNDCGGCEPPTNFNGVYDWTNEGFGTLLTWSYDTDPQSFKVYRSNDGIAYEVIATVDKAEREYFDVTDAGDYYYKVTAYRSYCESTPAWTNDDQDFVHVEVTSVSENGEEGLSVYPNPANALMSVEAEGLQQVTIYNMMGQVVYRQDCSEDGMVVNTSHFAPGIYTITVKTGVRQATQRFSVVH